MFTDFTEKRNDLQCVVFKDFCETILSLEIDLELYPNAYIKWELFELDLSPPVTETETCVKNSCKVLDNCVELNLAQELQGIEFKKLTPQESELSTVPLYAEKSQDYRIRLSICYDGVDCEIITEEFTEPYDFVLVDCLLEQRPECNQGTECEQPTSLQELFDYMLSLGADRSSTTLVQGQITADSNNINIGTYTLEQANEIRQIVNGCNDNQFLIILVGIQTTGSIYYVDGANITGSQFSLDGTINIQLTGAASPQWECCTEVFNYIQSIVSSSQQIDDLTTTFYCFNKPNCVEGTVAEQYLFDQEVDICHFEHPIFYQMYLQERADYVITHLFKRDGLDVQDITPFTSDDAGVYQFNFNPIIYSDLQAVCISFSKDGVELGSYEYKVKCCKDATPIYYQADSEQGGCKNNDVFYISSIKKNPVTRTVETQCLPKNCETGESVYTVGATAQITYSAKVHDVKENSKIWGSKCFWIYTNFEYKRINITGLTFNENGLITFTYA